MKCCYDLRYWCKSCRILKIIWFLEGERSGGVGSEWCDKDLREYRWDSVCFMLRNKIVTKVIKVGDNVKVVVTIQCVALYNAIDMVLGARPCIWEGRN